MKLKNKLLLWSSVIFDELVSVIFLTILISLLTIIVSFTYVTGLRYSRFKTTGKLFNIRDSFIYKLSLDEGFMSNANEHAEMIKKINSLDSIERVVGINTNSYVTTIVNTPRISNGKEDFPQDGDGVGVVSVSFISADYSNENVFPVITTDNRIIRKMDYDQIILDESASSIYSIGDKVWVDGFYFNSETEETEPRYAQVEIIGFVSRNQLILNSGSNTGSLKSFYTTFHDLEGETEVDGNIKLYFGLATGFKGNHDLYFSSINDPQMLIITKKESYSESEMLEQLEGIISNPKSVTPYSYYEEVYEKEYYTEIKLSLIYMFMSLVLVIVTLISFMKKWYESRKEEMVTYYILGTTWRESLLISLSPYLLSLVAGSLTGALIWNRYSTGTEDYLNKIAPMFFVIMFLLYIFVFVLCALPYYLKNMSTNPIEAYRSKGE